MTTQPRTRRGKRNWPGCTGRELPTGASHLVQELPALCDPPSSPSRILAITPAPDRARPLRAATGVPQSLLRPHPSKPRPLQPSHGAFGQVRAWKDGMAGADGPGLRWKRRNRPQKRWILEDLEHSRTPKSCQHLEPKESKRVRVRVPA